MADMWERNGMYGIRKTTCKISLCQHTTYTENGHQRVEYSSNFSFTQLENNDTLLQTESPSDNIL
jgi:hypothetical protein